MGWKIGFYKRLKNLSNYAGDKKASILFSQFNNLFLKPSHYNSSFCPVCAIIIIKGVLPMETQERVRIIDLAWDIVEKAQRQISPQPDTAVKQLTERFDQAYRAIVETVTKHTGPS